MIKSPKVNSPFSSDTLDNKKSLLSMKKLEEIIKNFNISSTQTIPDAHFVNGLLSFHRGMQTLSHQGFCNHLRSLASQFHHLGIHFLKPQNNCFYNYLILVWAEDITSLSVFLFHHLAYFWPNFSPF